ncbi:MAG: hypothetical protein U9N33_02540 [Campylobacterota bacterium]|nr:hypothetical protein [Campylobacterota bacterium]
MEVSTQVNNYQGMNQYQMSNTPKPNADAHVLPVKPQPEPQPPEAQKEYSNADVYKASQGNLIGTSKDDISLTPQGELNVQNAKDENSAEAQAQKQEKQDAQRDYAAGYIGHKSKQTQVEIYLSVATEGKVTLGNDTASIIESLRNVQKQNNAVEAYATYQQNKNSDNPVLY